MDFNNIEDLKREGFTGFKKFNDLFSDSSILPDLKGVYLVLYLKQEPVKFVSIGTGGHFKGKDPNVPISYLKEKWINDVTVIYIGKAGKEGGCSTIKSRLKQYLSFGRGKNIGHWGGRLIWQIQDAGELILCWKALKDIDCRLYESFLLQQFYINYKKRPFANLSD